MKVLTCKILALACVLSSAHPAFAAGWVTGYLPGWLVNPVSRAYGYVSPYLPATKADAQKIQTALKKELSAAEELLVAATESQNKTSDILKANLEDLQFLEKRSRKFKQEQEAKFIQHFHNLDMLDKSQEVNYYKLKENALQIAALKDQFAVAVVGMKNAQSTVHNFSKNLSQEIAKLQQSTLASYQELKLALDQQYSNKEQEYKGLENQLLLINKSVKVLQKTINDQSEKIESDSKEKNNLIAQLKVAAEALEKQNARIKAKKERKRKNESNSSRLLAQAASNVINK